jgi:site-specific recombinase XerD
MAAAALDEIRIGTMDDLKYWLHCNLVTCGKTHSAKHIELCKATLRYAVRQEYIQNNPIEPYQTSRDKVKEIIHLELTELKKIFTHTWNREMSEIVADLYVFQAFTGLSYGDLDSHEVVNDGKREWLSGDHGRGRNKNNNKYWSPLFGPAKWILEKYDGELPQISNQAYNRELKKICKELNINKRLSTHTARKTYVTIMHDHGFSLEWLEGTTGSGTPVLKKHYVKKSRNRLNLELDQKGSPFSEMATA